MDIDPRLRSCWLSRLERAIVACLYARAGLWTVQELLDLVEADLKEPVAEGLVRVLAARLTEVGILCARRGPGGGHCLAPAFRAWLDTHNSYTV